MTDTVLTVRVQTVGADEVSARLERCWQALEPQRESLVRMGWTADMAKTFVGEIATIMTQELVTVSAEY